MAAQQNNLPVYLFDILPAISFRKVRDFFYFLESGSLLYHISREFEQNLVIFTIHVVPIS